MNATTAALLLVTFAALGLALCAAKGRADREALIYDLHLSVADAEAERDRAREETERIRNRADLAVSVVVEQRDAMRSMAVESDNFSAAAFEANAAVAKRDAHLIELMIADRILPDLRDENDLAVPTWPLGESPIFDALKAETAFPWVLLPGVTLADNDADAVSCALSLVTR